ncbi:hypothetical protein [Janthinobacterium sp. HLS12-2]|uniref:hypothetical protein n=1 Tax=Janthinobacterium sp. HLS12-2 TaxID=1259324 RepID=UPI003F2965F6
MSPPNIKIHSGSRKPFAEEAPVVEAARQAAADIAQKYGKIEGAALFKGSAHIAALPTVHPQAVDIAREALSRLSNVSNGIINIPMSVTGQNALTALEIAKKRSDPATVRLREALTEAGAGQSMLESLRRLGINV